MNRIILAVFCSLMFTSCSSTTANLNYLEQSEVLKSDDLLKNIENKILQAFGGAMMMKNPKKLNELTTQLSELRKKKDQSLISYWSGYLEFYKSIYYQGVDDKNAAKKAIEKGIDLVSAIDPKNSEDFALLSMMESFSLQFIPGFKVPIISKRVKQNAKLAIKMDSRNLRGYFVYASNDFYTPEKFGGGKEAEEYLLKAIALNDQQVKNEYLPSWGKKEAYEMLIKLYIKKEDWNNAKKHFQDANELYPNDYMISQLAKKLIGH